MDNLVSIIIPAYQQAKWIGRCLQSVLDSSYHNCEIIVVNDGSTDKTEEIVQRYIEKAKIEGKPEWKLLNISHGGPSRARNAGLREAKGRFVGFFDADDMMEAKMLERLVASLSGGNDLAVCGLKLCDERGKPMRWQYPLKAQHRKCPGEALELVLWEQLLMSVSPTLFHRGKIVGEQGELLVEFPEEIHKFEDFVFICRYLSRCNGFMEIIPFYGAYYCRHAGSLSTKAYTAYELCHIMQLLLKAAGQAGHAEAEAYKLQYAFRFLAFWYKEAMRCGRKEFSPDCESWKVCMTELERYAEVFMSSKKVSCYKKLAMQIARKHAGLGRILAKTAGKLALGSRIFLTE